MKQSSGKIIIAALLIVFAGCKAQPPHENGNFKPTDLVELIKLDTSVHLDIRYATSNNLVHRPVYTQARAFLQRPAKKRSMPKALLGQD